MAEHRALELLAVHGRLMFHGVKDHLPRGWRGPYRSKFGLTKRATVLVPTAIERCIGPESGVKTARQPETSAATLRMSGSFIYNASPSEERMSSSRDASSCPMKTTTGKPCERRPLATTPKFEISQNLPLR